MPLRSPIVAGMFYPAHEAACRHEVETYLAQAACELKGREIVGGIVPHAGWAFSGLTAAHLYAPLSRQAAVDTVVLFGAVHSWRVAMPSLFGSGKWRCPVGYVAVDEELAQEVLRRGGDALADDPAAHRDEHSIEVQLPFLMRACPGARILPIAMPPMPEAADIGTLVAGGARALGRRAVAIGSSDLTHYGPRYGLAPAGSGHAALDWVHQNDARVLDLMVQMRGDEILEEVRTRHNACGAGAIAAAIAFAAEMGAARGHVAHYTTSYEVSPMGPASDMVGYGAVVFVT